MAKLTALHRKVGARVDVSDQPRGMTPEKALAQALSSAAQGYAGLQLRVLETRSGRGSQPEIISQLSDIAQFVVLGSAGEQRGVLMVGPELVDALIEVQTMGRLETTPRAPRLTTRIDAALSRDFVETLLEIFTARMADLADARWAQGYAYESYLADPRPLSLMLAEGDYRWQSARVDIGGGVRAADVYLACPAHFAKPDKTLTGNGKTETRAKESPTDPSWRMRLERNVNAAPMRLEAVLARLSLPVLQVETLRPGDVLPLAHHCLDQVRLESHPGAQGLGGRLGQQNGMRAVRLNLLLESAQPSVNQIATASPEETSVPRAEAESEPPPLTLPLLEPKEAALPPLPDLPSLPPHLGE